MRTCDICPLTVQNALQVLGTRYEGRRLIMTDIYRWKEEVGNSSLGRLQGDRDANHEWVSLFSGRIRTWNSRKARKQKPWFYLKARTGPSCDEWSILDGFGDRKNISLRNLEYRAIKVSLDSKSTRTMLLRPSIVMIACERLLHGGKTFPDFDMVHKRHGLRSASVLM